MYRAVNPYDPYGPSVPVSRREVFRRRDPFVAAMLSFWCCGLGQIYCGRVARGLGLMGLAYVGPLVALIVGFRLGDLVERHGGDFGATVGCYGLAVGLVGFSIWIGQVCDAWRLAVRSH